MTIALNEIYPNAVTGPCQRVSLCRDACDVRSEGMPSSTNNKQERAEQSYEDGQDKSQPMALVLDEAR